MKVHIPVSSLSIEYVTYKTQYNNRLNIGLYLTLARNIAAFRLTICPAFLNGFDNNAANYVLKNILPTCYREEKLDSLVIVFKNSANTTQTREPKMHGTLL